MNPGLDWLMATLGGSLLVVLLRLGRGPSLADRVVALDLLAVIGVSLLALFALKYEQPAFLDVAILLGLVGFIGSVAFARSMEPPAHDGRTSDKSELSEKEGERRTKP